MPGLAAFRQARHGRSVCSTTTSSPLRHEEARRRAQARARPAVRLSRPAQTLYDRSSCVAAQYRRTRFELPQIFFVRVAIDLPSTRVDPQARAIKFFVDLARSTSCRRRRRCSTRARIRSQLSSCYLTSVADDLDGHISTRSRKRDAVEVRRRLGQRLDDRAIGAASRAPTASRRASFLLKVVNDTAVAVNQGGKRQGAVVRLLDAGTSTWRSSSSCAKTPATTAAARTTSTPPTGSPMSLESRDRSGDWTLFSR